MRSSAIIALAAGALVALAADAHAHALLQHADPPVGGVVHGTPDAVRLQFSERVEPALCAVTIEDDAHHGAPLAALTTANDGLTLVAPLRAHLASGVYHVQWRAISVDTHQTQGAFVFRVAP